MKPIVLDDVFINEDERFERFETLPRT